MPSSFGLHREGEAGPNSLQEKLLHPTHTFSRSRPRRLASDIVYIFEALKTLPNHHKENVEKPVAFGLYSSWRRSKLAGGPGSSG